MSRGAAAVRLAGCVLGVALLAGCPLALEGEDAGGPKPSRVAGAVGQDPDAPAVVETVEGDASTVELHLEAGIPAAAREAFVGAGQLIADALVSPVAVEVEVSWVDLGEDDLGGARPTSSYFVDDGPVDDVAYPSALANALAGYDLDPDESDVVADFNSEVDWILPGGDDGFYDLERTVLHELLHGLGFYSSDVGDESSVDYGDPTFVYDAYVSRDGRAVLVGPEAHPSGSDELLDDLTSGDLVWSGPAAAAADRGRAPRLEAGEPYVEGTSVAHLDEEFYPAGTDESVMSPLDESGEEGSALAPVVLGMLVDMGWEVRTP